MVTLVSRLFDRAGALLRYREIENDRPPLVLLHAQGVDSRSFRRVMPRLARRFHVYSVDCYGHGGSLHDAKQYNMQDISRAVIAFIEGVIGRPVGLLGHSSGGLIAACVAAQSDWCDTLYLEDPPFFASQGERRKQTFNYVDLSTLCHDWLGAGMDGDFVLYYFEHQRAWQFFPEKSRENIRQKLLAAAKKYRLRHPNRDLWVPFWPKAALSAFQGMNDYDPRFGLAFYDDSFHGGLDHEAMLRGIRCPTVFMKAKTLIGEDGILQAALDEGDAERVAACIPRCTVVRFDCGHGIHVERPGAFVRCILDR